MISLKVNGKPIQLDGPTPLVDYLEGLGVSPRGVAVEYNGAIIERDAYATTTLADGDVVEIVRMVGGGGPATSRTVVLHAPQGRSGDSRGGETQLSI